MSVVGIIAEYNPLHEGHAYHIKRAREITGAHTCVCVLSSSFVQRGEPGIVSKWARTKMALHAGVDLVIELPSAFSCASAEYFASAGISLLEGLNCVDFLCFGSEAGKLDELETTAELLAFESEDFKARLKEALDEGLAFAPAREKALQMPEGSLNKPNNILGIEYIKAIRRMGSTLKPVTIERIGQDYHSLDRVDTYSSASAIRQHMGDIKEASLISEDLFLKNNLPEESLSLLAEECRAGRGPVFPDAYFSLLLHLLRRASEKELSLLPYVGEGLENRLKRASAHSTSYNELVSSVVTSRYPTSRIKRILISLLTGLTGELMEELKNAGYAQYVRVLGFNDTGRKLLSGIKRNMQLPLIAKPASYQRLVNPLALRLFENEIQATDTYVLGYPNAKLRLGGTELRSSPFYVKSSS